MHLVLRHLRTLTLTLFAPVCAAPPFVVKAVLHVMIVIVEVVNEVQCTILAPTGRQVLNRSRVRMRVRVSKLGVRVKVPLRGMFSLGHRACEP